MTAHLTARGGVGIPLVFVLENLRMNEYILGGGELAAGMFLSLLVRESFLELLTYQALVQQNRS